MDFVRVVYQSLGKPLVVGVQREGRDITASIVPVPHDKDPTKGIIGIQFQSKLVKYNPFWALYYGGLSTWGSIRMVFLSFNMLFSGEATFKDMAGPIGILQFASYSLSLGVMRFLEFVALISVSLGVINLFPFPVLDGGHVVFLVLEKLRGRPLAKKSEILVNNIGVALLVSLMLFVLINDAVSWNSRVELIQRLSGK